MKRKFMNNGKKMVIVWDKNTMAHKVNGLYFVYQSVKAEINAHQITIKEAHKRLQEVLSAMNVKFSSEPSWYAMPVHIDWSFEVCYGTSMTWDQLEDCFDRAFDRCAHMVSRNCMLDNLSKKMAIKLGFGEVTVEGEKFLLVPKWYAPSISSDHKRLLYHTSVTNAPLWTSLAIKA